MINIHIETDSHGEVEVPADELWGAQTKRSFEHFSIGNNLMPREMIALYATLKKTAAIANHVSWRLAEVPFKLIVQVCDEILSFSLCMNKAVLDGAARKFLIRQKPTCSAI
jgi:fumarate hydratase class II